MVLSLFNFILNPAQGRTLQKQVQQMIVQNILTGHFVAHARLPSSRALARHLKISRLTVAVAYSELVANDYLYARNRSGFFISPNATSHKNAITHKNSHKKKTDYAPLHQSMKEGQGVKEGVDWSKAIGQNFKVNITVSRPEKWREYPYPFIYGQVDSNLFDHHNWRLCAIEALGRKDLESLTADYYERDDPMLIEYILRDKLQSRGIFAQPDEVLITMGAQNALWICAQILLTQRRLAVMEDPCYPSLMDILTHTKCNLATVKVDDQGLPPENIPTGADVVFTTASMQCPTNSIMPTPRRQALLEKAEAENFLIIEDDYEYEIGSNQQLKPALKAMDQSGRVVYIGSFSKTLFPGLRLGYIVAPEAMIRAARALRGLILRHPPGHAQRTVAYFQSLGHYDSQNNRIRKALIERKAEMMQAIEDYGLEMVEKTATGGSSLWMKTSPLIDCTRLAKKLREDGVIIEPGEVFFEHSKANQHYYRLGLSSIPTQNIRDGVALIAKHVQNEAS